MGISPAAAAEPWAATVEGEIHSPREVYSFFDKSRSQFLSALYSPDALPNKL